jgi:hypothetical protein
MKAVLSSIRRRLDAMPVWAVLGINALILGLWMIDFQVPDEIPIDKILIGVMFAGTSVYLWRRYFGAPSALAAESRRRLAEIETLFEESKKASASLAGAGGVQVEVERLGALLTRVRQIQKRIEQTELVLQSREYDEVAAKGEVTRLETAVAGASDATKANFSAALMEAQAHLANIQRIKSTRDELGAAFERFFQIFRRIHSQIIGMGLAQGTEGELTSSVDELAKALDEYERENVAMAHAEDLVDKELAEAKRAEEERLEKLRASANADKSKLH